MVVDKLNADFLLTLIARNGVETLANIVQFILSGLCITKIDKLEAKVKEEIVSKYRRFGKGATLLAPFGFFHPSETISVVRTTQAEADC